MVCLQTYAVPANPKPVTITQPNGDELTLIMKGDEYIHWAETLDGYTLLSNSDFIFCYAQLNDSGNLEPSQFIATEISNRPHEVSLWLQNIDKKLFYSDEQVYQYMQIREMYEKEYEREQFEYRGNRETRKLLVIFMEFPEKPAKKSKEEFMLLFNQINYFENGFRGSVKDFFLESSYNKLEINATVVGPYLTKKESAYYAYEPSSNYNPNYPEFAREAINAAYEDGVDFSEFATSGNQIESVYAIYSGYDKSTGGCNTCIWAHAQRSFYYNYKGFVFKSYAASSELEGYAGSTISTIGTFCHEFGHSLGAPDYYDTDYEKGGKYDGTGYWDLQASGSHNDGGKIPATPNPRSKITTYKWATAIELNTPQKCTIPVSRIYDNAYFKITTTDPNQYFLIENKKQEGFDSSIPGKNLLIYKCTENYDSGPQNTTSWQRFYPVSANAPVAVPEAGTNKQSQYGSINSSTCTWPQTSKKDFTNSSIPGMVTWDGNGVNKPITNMVVHDDFITFDFMGGGTKSNFHVFLPAYYGCMVKPVAGSSSPVNTGGNFSFTIDLLPSHDESKLVVKANNITLTPSSNIYTISDITKDIIVRIEELKFNTFPIFATAGENGTISPGGEVAVNFGGMKKFDIKTSNGFSIDKVIVDGDDKGKINSYTFMNVLEPHTIHAYFKKGDTYTINSSITEAFFETKTNVPSEKIEVILSSPNVIANIAVNAPERFQVSGDDGKNWQKGFSVKPNQLPYKFWIRFFPSWGSWNVGTFNEVLTLKSTDAYAEIKLTGLSHVGINDNVNESAIVIYPNPTTGKLTIENGQLLVDNVEIFDVFGRKVFEQKTESGKQNEIDVSNLCSGIYLMKIYTDSGVVHKKVVKE